MIALQSIYRDVSADEEHETERWVLFFLSWTGGSVIGLSVGCCRQHTPSELLLLPRALHVYAQLARPWPGRAG